MIDFEKQTAQQKEHTAGVRILHQRQRRTGRQDSTVPQKGRHAEGFELFRIPLRPAQAQAEAASRAAAVRCERF